jgi:hypothetical protein
MVDLDGVEKRAAELGRTTTHAVASEATAPVAPGEATAPPGTMIVPIDAWNKMLNQLGNLHEAGQQLASARERAAKAETEAKFLRERLAEMRRGDGHPIEEDPEAPEPPESPDTPQPPEKVWQYLVRRVRDRGLG